MLLFLRKYLTKSSFFCTIHKVYMKNISLLGVSLDLGGVNLGVDIGPNAFRHRNIIKKLEAVGFKVTDAGNIVCKDKKTLTFDNPRLKYLEEIVRVSNRTAHTVNNLLLRDQKVVVLGGDHTVSLGAISGASITVKNDLGLIYFDAHGDLNTDKTTLTGNIHGMHLASLIGYGNKQLRDIYRPVTKIYKRNVLHIGGYDFDTYEAEFIKKEKMNFYKILDLLSNGLKPLFTHIDKLQKKVKNLWVSLDLDAIDYIYAPGVGMQNKSGLTYREITTLCDYIGQKCNVIGMDIVEYNPLMDTNGMTAELSIELIAKILGSNYSWYTNYLDKNKL